MGAWRRVIVGAVALLATLAPAAAAHETKSAGPLRLTLGWSEEPAFSNLANAVQVEVSAGDVPVIDLTGSLTVEVTFGGQSTQLALVPAARPGELRARLVPTQPGVYSFHVSGVLQGHTIDVTSTCSATTFDCVADVGEVQFPSGSPSIDQIAERLAREVRRSGEARSAASTARVLATASAVLAIAAMVVAVVTGGRLRKVRRSA